MHGYGVPGRRPVFGQGDGVPARAGTPWCRHRVSNPLLHGAAATASRRGRAMDQSTQPITMTGLPAQLVGMLSLMVDRMTVNWLTVNTPPGATVEALPRTVL